MHDLSEIDLPQPDRHVVIVSSHISMVGKWDGYFSKDSINFILRLVNRTGKGAINDWDDFVTEHEFISQSEVTKIRVTSDNEIENNGFSSHSGSANQGEVKRIKFKANVLPYAKLVLAYIPLIYVSTKITSFFIYRVLLPLADKIGINFLELSFINFIIYMAFYFFVVIILTRPVVGFFLCGLYEKIQNRFYSRQDLTKKEYALKIISDSDWLTHPATLDVAAEQAQDYLSDSSNLLSNETDQPVYYYNKGLEGIYLYDIETSKNISMNMLPLCERFWFRSIF